MKTETIKSDIRKALALCPDFKVLEIVGKGTFTSKKAFGNKVLELLEDSEVSDISLSAVTEKGYLGKCVNGVDDAITCNAFNGKVEHLSFSVKTVYQMAMPDNGRGYGQEMNMGD